MNHAYRFRWLSGSSSRGIKRNARSIDRFVYGRKSSTHIEPSMRVNGNGTSAVSTLVDMFPSLKAILQLCQRPLHSTTSNPTEEVNAKFHCAAASSSSHPANVARLKTTSPARTLPGLAVALGPPLTQAFRDLLAFASWPPGWATAHATTNAPRRALAPGAYGCARAQRWRSGAWSLPRSDLDRIPSPAAAENRRRFRNDIAA